MKALDNDDCIRLRELAHSYNNVTKRANDAIIKWMCAETELDKQIIRNNVKDTLSWKKQVLALISAHPEWDDLHTQFMEGKQENKLAENILKAIEMEMNALKKIFEVTPD